MKIHHPITHPPYEHGEKLRLTLADSTIVGRVSGFAGSSLLTVKVEGVPDSHPRHTFRLTDGWQVERLAFAFEGVA